MSGAQLTTPEIDLSALNAAAAWKASAVYLKLTLFGWIPTVMRIRAVVSEDTRKSLEQQFPDAEIIVKESFTANERICMGRCKRVEIDQEIQLTTGQESEKMARYGELVRALMEDQLRWIADPSHDRRITEANGRESLRMAIAARELAQASQPKNRQRIR